MAAPLEVNVADYRDGARRRLPRLFFDYLEGGASQELTLAANRAGFSHFSLVQRSLRDVARRSLAATVLGAPMALPLMLGPVGFLGAFRARGEETAFRAAADAGIGACLSAFSLAPFEAVLGRDSGAALQLYVMKDRDWTLSILDRARRIGTQTIFVTVDTAVTGRRERDMRNGFRRLSRPDAGLVADFLRHPAWLFDMARAPRLRLAITEGRPELGDNIMQQAGAVAAQIDPAFDWSGLDWLRREWKGRLVVKGLMHADDARRAVDAGADGIVVSNHGGRQLDGAAASLLALPAIAAAVGGRAEILFDGGIRDGSELIKALALGADACLIGRAYAYGLAAGGERGVAAIIEMIRAQMDVTMALMGLRSVAELKEARGAWIEEAGRPVL